EAVGKALALDRERVVAGADQRVRQAAEDTAVGMVHRRGLAVHHPTSMDDPRAEGRADALVAETDAEDRQPAGELADRRHRNAGLGGGAGSGRDDELLG